MRVFIISILLSLSVNAATDNIWYKGNIEDAFKLAKKSNTPLFLYWGAVWCPPCNMMKSKVFNTSIFKNELKNFIPIYLDGDSKRAQVWGDKLKTSGYPTMIVLDSNAQEVSRLPIIQDSVQFVNQLKEIRNNLTSIKALSDKCIQKKCTSKEWTRLSLHSWMQEELIPEEKLEGIFYDLYIQSSKAKNLTQYSFLLLYLNKTKKKAYDPIILKGINNLISDKVALYENLMSLSYTTDKIKKLLNKKQLKIIKKVLKEVNATSKDFSEKLAILMIESNLELRKKNEIINDINIIDKKLSSSNLTKNERQNIMSDLIYSYMVNDELNIARKVCLREIEKSHSPYYFMSYMSSIEKKSKNMMKALKWSRRAWQESKGPATRIQWGSSYLRKALEFKIVDFNKLHLNKDLTVYLNESKKTLGLFNGRNARSLKKLLEMVKKSEDKSLTKLVSNLCNNSSEPKKCGNLKKEIGI